MADMLDYLAWRGDIPFSRMPVNPVDALIFSALSYIRFEDIVPDSPLQQVSLPEAAAGLFSLEAPESRVRVKKDLELLEAAAQAPRFANLKMSFYRSILIPEVETQFAAVAFFLDDGSAFLTFRGTDSTLVGWKEDFNMAFQPNIPGQLLALAYVQEFANAHPVPIWIGGHSKGGNLAAYAAAKCGELLQKRIMEVHNQDGPGFSEEMMNDPGYQRILPKLRTFVPQSSVVGMLLEHEEPHIIIKSNQVGLMQHDPYSWMVSGPDFIRMEELTPDSQFLDRTLKNWLAKMPNQERGEFIDTVFDLLGAGGAEHTSEIMRPQNIIATIKTLHANENIRGILSSELANLVRSARSPQEETDDNAMAEVK